MSWLTQDLDIETDAWSLGDLRAGDLVFGQKDSGPLAWLCERANEPWRHVGSLIEVDGALKVVEVLGDSFCLRALPSFFDPSRYVLWGAARPQLDQDCVDAANQWMTAHLDGGDRAEHVYAWDDLILAGIISASQRGLFASHPDRVRSAITAAAGVCKASLTYQDRVSLTCSSFIQFAYEHAGKMCNVRHRRWRSESGSWPADSPGVDDVLAMTDAELVAFGDASLIDVFLAAERIDRGTATTKARPAHIAEMLKVLLAAVGGYAVGDPAPAGLGADSRWVTPGDLWRSPSFYPRAYVAPS